MSKNKHIIHRVNLEIDAPDTETAKKVQEDALRILKNDILPELEKHLDGIDNNSNSLRFDGFNLNLDSINAEDFDKEFAEAFKQQFTDRLGKAISRKPDAGDSVPEPYDEFSAGELQAELLIYFLEYGQMPWWSSDPEILKDESQLLGNKLFTEPFRSRLASLLIRNRLALDRLLLQYSDDFSIRLVYGLLAEETMTPNDAAKFFKEIFASGITIEEMIDQLLYEYQKLHTNDGSNLDSRLKIIHKKTDHHQRLKPNPKDSAEKDSEKVKQPDSQEEGIFVNNAGLVILHPFLEYFFREFDLLEGIEFRSRSAQFIAIHLLHYLATGTENAMEHELLFEKYLCGWNPEEPVPRRFRLSKRMKDESEKLLQSAIGHWKALKKTSPNGLREGFLQRNGKIVPDDFQHRLIVEGNSIDVLLSFLPWGIGVVKLPWLEQMLIVEWNH